MIERREIHDRVRARVCMCVQAYLAFCYLVFLRHMYVFVLFVFVFLHLLVIAAAGWLDGIWLSALSRAPAPTLWWALARFPVPSHPFLPFNPFLYRPCATPPPPNCLCMTVAFMDSKCLGVYVCERVCKCVCASESDVHCCAPLVPAGAGCPAFGCCAVCADEVGSCPHARPLPWAGVDKAAGRRRLCF